MLCQISLIMRPSMEDSRITIVEISVTVLVRDTLFDEACLYIHILGLEMVLRILGLRERKTSIGFRCWDHHQIFDVKVGLSG